MDTRCRVLVQLFAAAAFAFCFASWSKEQQAQEELLTPLSEVPITIKGGEIGGMLRKWYSDGTAAGNAGDYYDNRDGGHSLLNLAPYPQLQKIEYTEEQIKKRQNWGIQDKILPYVVFGNSSTSSSPKQGGSNVRRYYTDPRGLAFLFAQYARNNLYIYPEHLDHDPGHNGAGGYGDLFPTNTPYLIASQGSSGSDQSFMRALPYVLAAFRPEVKKKLAQSGMLMPTIQMILRITNRRLAGANEYLTGKAHPTVFSPGDVNTLEMVEMAHGITLSKLPPLALIKMVKEDAPVNGVDCFEPEYTEKLADTPAVIARIFRGSNYLRKIVVSAEQSRDLNNRPLKFYWAVLRGDPSRIRIEYLNSSRSVAEITIPYHNRAPIAEGSSLESNRVDIGVFVHNGAYYSPPAFITFYTLDNEARTYGADGRVLEIAYGAGTSTISVADWRAFFNLIESHSESWPSTFLRKQFKAEEIAELGRVSEEFRKAHETLLAAQQELNAARETGDKSAADLAASRKAVNDAQQSEKDVLRKKIHRLNAGTIELVQKALNSLLQEPDLWNTNANELKLLYESAGNESKELLGQIQKTLVQFGIAENSGGSWFQLKPLKKGDVSPTGRPTPYEKGMIERLNAIVLSRIVFPGLVNSEWRENYVDFRIASAKGWRDVYRYAPDGTPVGWLRYQSGGTAEFNAEGLLILDKDPQGRCIRARVVRYELEPQKQDPSGLRIEPFLKKVKLVQTDMLREYEYAGENDWKGQVKSR